LGGGREYKLVPNLLFIDHFYISLDVTVMIKVLHSCVGPNCGS